MDGMWLLMLDNTPVALRFKTYSGKVADIELDKLKDVSSYPLTYLPQIPLVPYKDLYVTQDEVRLNQMVDSFKGDLKSIETQIKTYFLSRNKENLATVRNWYEKSPYQTRQEQAKLIKKKQDLRNEFCRIVPGSFLERFITYHMENFEGNSNIYKGYNKDQLQIVRDYFRWSSKLIFYRNGDRHVLKVSVKKAEKLAAIMKTADDWRYDGTIDTGATGGAHCELGHALRYAHYAVSPSLNVEVIFGEKCVSDFFSIDQSAIKEIVAIQGRLIGEMKYITFLRDNPDLLDKHIQRYSEDLWECMKYFKGRFNDLIASGAGFAAFIGGFHKAKLPLTPTLLSHLEKWISQMKREKVQEEEAKEREAQQAKNPVPAPNPDPAPAPAPNAPLNVNATDTISASKPSPAKTLRQNIKENGVEGMGILNVLLDPTYQPADAGDYVALVNAVKTKNLVNPNKFGFKVIETVKKINRVTDNQKKYLDEILDGARGILKQRLVEQNKPSEKVVVSNNKPKDSTTKESQVDKEDEVDHNFTKVTSDDGDLPF